MIESKIIGTIKLLSVITRCIDLRLTVRSYFEYGSRTVLAGVKTAEFIERQPVCLF